MWAVTTRSRALPRRTRARAYETNLSYSQAAPFALVMMVVAAVPSYLLGRFFQRPAVTRG
jgi:hypothetical protein